MRDLWPSSHGTKWTAAVAALYTVLYSVNELLADWFQTSIIPGRLAVIFLPAFVRVTAVAVAGTAGLLGLFIGSLLIAVFHLHDPPVQAFFVSLASAMGAWASYTVTVWALKPQGSGDQLPLTLPVLLVMTVFCSIFNALVHAIVWSILGTVERLGLLQIAQMMFGDLLGVAVIFLLMRWTIRLFRAVRPAAT